mgnify:CR=1 FL=1
MATRARRTQPSAAEEEARASERDGKTNIPEVRRARSVSVMRIRQKLDCMRCAQVIESAATLHERCGQSCSRAFTLQH